MLSDEGNSQEVYLVLLVELGDYLSKKGLFTISLIVYRCKVKACKVKA